VSALLLGVLVLQAACATGRTMGGTGVGLHGRSLLPPPSAETRARWAAERSAPEGGPYRFSRPVDFGPLEVGEEEVSQALASLVLDVPPPHRHRGKQRLLP